MNYIVLFCIGLIILHFILYYLNIDPLQLNKPIVNTSFEVDTTIDATLDDSINELKKLNEYIDNECRNNAVCEAI
jgi:hypothetical protein